MQQERGLNLDAVVADVKSIIFHRPHVLATQVDGVHEVFQYQTVAVKLPFMYFSCEPTMRAF